MSYYFDLNELREELRESRVYSKRFEMLQTYKLNNLKELCGRLPEENEVFLLRHGKVLQHLLLLFTCSRIPDIWSTCILQLIQPMNA